MHLQMVDFRNAMSQITKDCPQIGLSHPSYRRVKDPKTVTLPEI